MTTVAESLPRRQAKQGVGLARLFTNRFFEPVPSSLC